VTVVLLEKMLIQISRDEFFFMEISRRENARGLLSGEPKGKKENV
jgi:hypothetical protein